MAGSDSSACRMSSANSSAEKASFCARPQPWWGWAEQRFLAEAAPKRCSGGMVRIFWINYNIFSASASAAAREAGSTPVALVSYMPLARLFFRHCSLLLGLLDCCCHQGTRRGIASSAVTAAIICVTARLPT